MKEEKTLKIKTLISEGKISEAINELVNKFPNKESYSIQARYNELKRKDYSGLITGEEDRKETNLIIRQLLSEIEKRENTPKKRSRKIKARGVIFIWIAVLFLLMTHWRNQNSISRFESFDILILPFNPYKSCNIETNNYDYIMFERLQEISRVENLNLSISLFEPDVCPLPRKDIISLGKDKKADVVMWGKYIEGCTDSLARINYQITPIDYDLSGIEGLVEYDEVFHNVENIEEVARGTHQEYLIFKLFEHIAAHKSKLRFPIMGNYKERIQIYFDIKRKGVEYYIDDTGTLIISLTRCWFDLAMFSVELLVDKQLKNRTEILTLYIDEIANFQNYIREKSDFKDITYLEQSALSNIVAILKISLEYGQDNTIYLEDLNETIKFDIQDDEKFRKKIIEEGLKLYESKEEYSKHFNDLYNYTEFEKLVNLIE